MQKEKGDFMKNKNFTVIFLNNGSAVFKTEGYAHYHDDMTQLAQDVKCLVNDNPETDWDGNEIENFDINSFDDTCLFWDGKDLNSININYGFNAENFVEAMQNGTSIYNVE